MLRNTTRFIVSWIISILVIILLIFAINFISYFIPNPIIKDIVQFINNNIILIILISFLFFLGSFFYHLGFPANLCFPIFDAFGGAFLVYVIIKLLVLLDKYALTGIGNTLDSYSYIISIVIFFLILIFGYISILHYHNRRYRHHSYRDDRVYDDTIDEPRVHTRKDREYIEEDVIDEPRRRPIHRKRVVRRRSSSR